MDWAIKLRSYRAQEGVKQEVLAERLGVSQAFVSRLEAGQVDPGEKLSAQIQRLLHDPANRSVLEHIINNVRHSPHICCLLRAETDQLRYVALSQGLIAHPQNESRREGHTLRTDISQGGSELARAVLESGVFTGEIETLDVLWVVEFEGVTYHWRGVMTPIQYDAKTWYLHCALVQMTEVDFQSLLAKRGSALIENRYN